MPKCFKCKNSAFGIQNLRFAPQIKKQIVEVIVPCHVCKECNEPLLDEEQANTLRRAAADRYRELKGLLTSKDLVAFREKLSMSQTNFARFLSVGEASIKRWETYYIQDHSQDDHIRIKCDETYSESHYFYLKYKCGRVDIYSGLKRFSADLVRHVCAYFKQALPNCAHYLRKLHFYSDFLHFKRHNQCITGLRYIPSKSGPSPYHYDLLASFLDKFDAASNKGVEFDDQEKQTLDDVCDFFLRDSGQLLCDLSKKEKGFLETDELDFISYQYATDLLI